MKCSECEKTEFETAFAEVTGRIDKSFIGCAVCSPECLSKWLDRKRRGVDEYIAWLDGVIGSQVLDQAESFLGNEHAEETAPDHRRASLLALFIERLKSRFRKETRWLSPRCRLAP
jgi:hypothetical protein